MSFYGFAKAVTGGLLSLLFHMQYRGRENIPEEGGVIVACNHQSYLDPVIAAQKIPHQLRFMAKAELFKVPVLGFIIRHLNAFPVERGKGDTGAIDYAVETIKSRHCLLIFPEGTRSKTGELLRPRSGISVIAHRTGADVLPVSIAFSHGRRFRSRVVVTYGEVIPFADLGLSEGTPSEIKGAARKIMEKIQKQRDSSF